ncbi:hypothetical protein ACMHYJ_07325 [Castellaniella hirudinis]|uniref:hypothetical protein n=1 Tax=Castellaniella hirudinis TaxID=1144617 RepID=UPI0039C3C0ED
MKKILFEGKDREMSPAGPDARSDKAKHRRPALGCAGQNAGETGIDLTRPAGLKTTDSIS